MGLRIIKTKDGSHRPTWYARFTRDGRKIDVNLKVPIRGRIPLDEHGNITLKVQGDSAFETSRREAEERLRMGTVPHRTGTVPTDHTGTVPASIADLPQLWRAIPRNYTPSEHRLRLCDATFRAFARFVRKRGQTPLDWGLSPSVANLLDITPELARDYFDDLCAHYAWTTVKSKMALLARAYALFSPGNRPNPFKIIAHTPRISEDVQTSPPLTRSQIDTLLNPTREDAFFHPLIVTALCTGLRIGDVCTLAWTDVNLTDNTLFVPASTRTERVILPILPPLRAILEACSTERSTTDTFVFPDAARRYSFKTETGVYSRRSYIINGLKPILGELLAPSSTTPTDAPVAPPTKDEVISRIRTAAFTPGKTRRLIMTYQQFSAGKSYSQIAALTGKNKGQCSADLKTIEDLTGHPLRLGSMVKSKFAGTGQTIAQLTARTRHRQTNGKRCPSLYGWRSFRLAFHTLATEAGIASEKIEMVIGHENVRKMRGLDRQALAHAPDTPATHPDHIAARVLSLVRAIIPPKQAELVNTILHAAGVDADVDPKRALDLVGSAVSKARSRIAAVLKSAGL